MKLEQLKYNATMQNTKLPFHGDAKNWNFSVENNFFAAEQGFQLKINFWQPNKLSWEPNRVYSLYLADAIDEITKEEPRRANEKLLPFGSISERNPKQRPSLLFILVHFHLSCLFWPLTLPNMSFKKWNFELDQHCYYMQLRLSVWSR